MSSIRIAIVGSIGALAREAAEVLRRRGHCVSVLNSPRLPRSLPGKPPSRLVCMPFSPSMERQVLQRKDADLAYLRSILDWAKDAGLERVVLRSHAVAYGISMKNPGLLDEGRPTLLPKASLDRRWLEAEEALFSHAGARESVSGRRYSTAAVRLTSVLAPEESDLVTRMVSRRLVVPMAGYDPELQFLDLADAAEALADAVLSDSSGVFNVSPDGTVPTRAALKASARLRIPVSGVFQKPVRSFLWRTGLARFPGEAMDRIKYNWTVSNDRARLELGFSPRFTSSAALKEHLRRIGRDGHDKIKEEYDAFGLDPEYLEKWAWWFHFLTRIYWRAEAEGLENVPAAGRALLVSNHRGFMPFDGVVHRSLILKARKRHIRFLVIPSLFKFPFLSDFLIKQGGVVASQSNTRKLFERENLVGIFPEGINGAFRMYKGAYRLGDMSRNAFAKMAIEHGAPIIPCATIGHVEIFPILAKVRSSLVVRVTGWPFLPITPTFPLLPIPLPTKWHIRYLDPVPVDGYTPSDAQNPEAVNELARTTCEVMQRNIDEMLRRRRHIFFGNIFGGQEDAGQAKAVDAAG